MELKPRWLRKGSNKGRRSLPPHIQQYFIDHYLAAETPADFLAGLERATGHVMSWKDARDYASNWGIASAVVRPAGWLVNALAWEIRMRGGNISPDHIRWMIKQGQLRAGRSVGRLCVAHADAWRLIDKLTAPVCPFDNGEPLMPVAEADRLLGYSSTRPGEHVRKPHQNGRIRGCKRGRFVYVYRADVMAALAYLERTGDTAVPWMKLKKERIEA